MKNVYGLAMMATMMVGCSNVVPNTNFLNIGGGGSGGGNTAAPSTQEPLNPSDEFASATFDTRRWKAYDLNTLLPVTQTADGIQVGDSSSNAGTNAFRLKANYTVDVKDLYGDSVVAEFHIKMSGSVDQTGVTAYFENGKKINSYIYKNLYDGSKVMGRVDIYDVDGATLLFHSTPVTISDGTNVCQEYKVNINYNADSTAQWNVSFSDNCASVGYVSQIALDHASLGGTDYIGNVNGKVRFELFGNRLPVAPDSNADPLFGVVSGVHYTTSVYASGNGGGAVYSVELLNWNCSVTGAKLIEE